MSEREAEFDGRSLWEDTEHGCSFARTLDSPLTARPSPLIVSMLWFALGETEQTEAADGKGVQVVPAVGSVSFG